MSGRVILPLAAAQQSLPGLMGVENGYVSRVVDREFLVMESFLFHAFLH
jgi:hypothetical protein